MAPHRIAATTIPSTGTGWGRDVDRENRDGRSHTIHRVFIVRGSGSIRKSALDRKSTGRPYRRRGFPLVRASQATAFEPLEAPGRTQREGAEHDA
jgi:hypothetical protein